jgi:hypothetical protein
LSQREEQRRLSKEELLQPRIREQDVEITGLGGTVRLRSFSHRTRLEVREKAGYGTPQYDENRYTNLCIVHALLEPKLIEEDIDALQDQDQSIYDELVLHISVLNFMGQAGDLKKGSNEILNSDSDSNLPNDSG